MLIIFIWLVFGGLAGVIIEIARRSCEHPVARRRVGYHFIVLGTSLLVTAFITDTARGTHDGVTIAIAAAAALVAVIAIVVHAFMVKKSEDNPTNWIYTTRDGAPIRIAKTAPRD